VLPGWETSTGAKHELDTARATGSKIWLALKWVEDWIIVPQLVQPISADSPIDLDWDAAETLVNGTPGRVFESGANRDDDTRKMDFEGFLSPVVVRRYAEYMHAHRFGHPDGIRAADNWQRGIPQEAYMKSAWRHFMDWWLIHRDHVAEDADGQLVDVQDALCALLFNVQGYLHEVLK
jgi:hypothetical protein